MTETAVATEKKSPLAKLMVMLEMVKIEHTVFALPFAYMGAFLAAKGFPGWHDFLWITAAMVGARSLAMSLNRLIDMRIDGLNPRTAERALPAGLVKVGEVIIFAGLSLGLLLLAAFSLAPICRVLWPLPVIPFVIYPYTKRFTSLCHLVLGFSIGLAPTGAWLAITNGIAPAPLLLSLAVTLWIGGFDIIYATQDVDFDRQQGLRSLPVRLGLAGALFDAKLWHIGTIICLLAVGFNLDLGLLYFLGVLLTACLIAYENAIVKPTDLSRVKAAFFTVNGVISILMCAATIGDIYLSRMFGHG